MRARCWRSQGALRASFWRASTRSCDATSAAHVRACRQHPAATFGRGAALAPAPPHFLRLPHSRHRKSALRRPPRAPEMHFEPLPGPHGFGAQLVGGVSPAALARIDAAQVDALAAALDAHALLVLHCDTAASAAELAAFATRLLGSGGLVDFSGVSADARNQGAGSALCHAEGVPAVRVLGNVTGAGGEAKALLCRIGACGSAGGVKRGCVARAGL